MAHGFNFSKFFLLSPLIFTYLKYLIFSHFSILNWNLVEGIHSSSCPGHHQTSARAWLGTTGSQWANPNTLVIETCCTVYEKQ